MGDLFKDEMSDKAEIEQLNRLVDELRRAGIKLRNELSDFVQVAITDNANSKVFPKAQEAISEWNELNKQSDLAWKEEILSAPCEATLKLYDN